MAKYDCKYLLDKALIYHYGRGQSSPETLAISLHLMNGDPEETVDLSHDWGHVCTLHDIGSNFARYKIEDA